MAMPRPRHCPCQMSATIWLPTTRIKCCQGNAMVPRLATDAAKAIWLPRLPRPRHSNNPLPRHCNLPLPRKRHATAKDGLPMFKTLLKGKIARLATANSQTLSAKAIDAAKCHGQMGAKSLSANNPLAAKACHGQLEQLICQGFNGQGHNVAMANSRHERPIVNPRQGIQGQVMNNANTQDMRKPRPSLGSWAKAKARMPSKEGCQGQAMRLLGKARPFYTSDRA
uniref:Uncharacterized protein n=1 Tax=Fagus sylvatica TaxID=28930 RepID=A0A2N9FUU8_FAGSY